MVMKNQTRRTFLLGFLVGVLIMAAVLGGAAVNLIKKNNNVEQKTVVADEESVVTKVVAESSPSVVTVAMSGENMVSRSDFFNSFFNLPQPTTTPQDNYQNIGTGFVISSDGLIVTNKHVVEDTNAKYRVLIGKDEIEEVVNIYRDPTTDLAILKVNKIGLIPLTLGNSDQIKVGQTVIAIGTALGEFRSTVTTGVVSGLGRAIVAGSLASGSSERLDDVIQTDAAINSGNSGGPLLNSAGQVIGVNVAMSQAGQNIGFALPINLVKQSIDNFRTTGEFDRPYMGVGYRMISKQTALMNDVAAGAYVQEVISGSPAEKAGIKVGDVITEIDGTKLADNTNFLIAEYINKKKIGDSVSISLWRDNKQQNLTVKLEKKSN
jgi:serine protease Do